MSARSAEQLSTLNEVYCDYDNAPSRCVCDFLAADGRLTGVLMFHADPDAGEFAVGYVLAHTDENDGVQRLELPDDPFSHLRVVAAWLTDNDDQGVRDLWLEEAEKQLDYTRAQATAVARQRLLELAAGRRAQPARR
jgi:hypothetical protein